MRFWNEHPELFDEVILQEVLGRRKEFELDSSDVQELERVAEAGHIFPFLENKLGLDAVCDIARDATANVLAAMIDGAWHLVRKGGT